MSSMIQQPPRSIPVNGGPQGGAPGGAQAPGGDVDPASVKKNLQTAYQALMAAASAEGHDPDGAQMTALAAKVHALIAASTTLQDQVMGAGPGVQMIRKAGGGSQGGSGY